MANPRPLHFTTGNYATRSDLRRAITTLRRFNLGWEEIGKTVGVSERTAKRCFEEAEAERKECRAQAYERSEQLCGGTVTAEQATSLPTAVKVYAMLVIALILLAAAIAFNR